MRGAGEFPHAEVGLPPARDACVILTEPVEFAG